MFRLYSKFNILLWLIFSERIVANEAETESDAISRAKRYLTFTYNSAVGMILAFAVPLEIPTRSVIFSYNFEANYNLPTNITMYNLTPPSRSLASVLNRTYVYNKLEDFINRLGAPGRQCILRLICEVAQSPLHHNGLLGHIVHILFTPSTSVAEGLEEEERAESDGLGWDTDCASRYEACPLSIIDSISSYY